MNSKLLSYFFIRMSLAMYAAPFNEESYQVASDDIEKKRISSKNKTQKHFSSPKDDMPSNKAMSVLKTIHNLPDTYTNELSNFSPIPPPSSSGVETTKIRDNNTNNSINNSIGSNVNNSISSNLGKNYSSFIGSMNDSEENEDYYKRFIPNYEEMYKKQPQHLSPPTHPQYNHNQNNQYSNSQNSQDVLIDKLNYMINLLEEQQDEKTNNITEEIILYSFLGIFVIFIVDSFSRVGKYTR
jgi:hypothetical protein